MPIEPTGNINDTRIIRREEGNGFQQKKPPAKKKEQQKEPGKSGKIDIKI